MHRHEFNGTGLLCESTGKIASVAWTNHDRAKRDNGGRLVPNTCKHCREPGEKVLSLNEALRRLNEQRASRTGR